MINNRPDMEGGPPEDNQTSTQIEEAARVAGLRLCLSTLYVAGQITEVDVRTFANNVNGLPKPVLMFCRPGNRSNNLYQLAKQMDLFDD